MYFFIFLFILTPVFSSAQSIDGEWVINKRRCASQTDWQEVPPVHLNFDLKSETSTVTLEQGGCTLVKTGKLKQLDDSNIVFCKPKAESSGNCDQNIIDHVRIINSLPDECSDQRKISFSEDGSQLFFSELINHSGFACSVGEDLFYELKKAN